MIRRLIVRYPSVHPNVFFIEGDEPGLTTMFGGIPAILPEVEIFEQKFRLGLKRQGKTYLLYEPMTHPPKAKGKPRRVPISGPTTPTVA